MSDSGIMSSSQDETQNDPQIFAQVWEEDDVEDTYESVAAMELRQEEDKLAIHQAHLRLLLMREKRVIEDIKQRRRFEYDCHNKIDALRAQVNQENVMIVEEVGTQMTHVDAT